MLPADWLDFGRFETQAAILTNVKGVEAPSTKGVNKAEQAGKATREQGQGRTTDKV